MKNEILVILLRRIFNIFKIEYNDYEDVFSNIDRNTEIIKTLFEESNFIKFNNQNEKDYFEANEILNQLKSEFPDILFFHQLSGITNYRIARLYWDINVLNITDDNIKEGIDDFERCIELKESEINYLLLARSRNFFYRFINDFYMRYPINWQKATKLYPRNIVLRNELSQEYLNEYAESFFTYDLEEDLTLSLQILEPIKNNFFLDIEKSLQIDVYNTRSAL